MLKFWGLILLAIGVNYFTPPAVSSLFFLATLVVYFRSKNEAFWLAFYLAISNGIMGFFGLYSAVVTIIPGLPPVEVGQLYIMLTGIKVLLRPKAPRPFYQLMYVVLMIYVFFLFAQGYTVGLSTALNVQFRVVKFIVPLLLLITVPKLMPQKEQYEDFFRYIFTLVLSALFTQVFTIVTATTPSNFIGATEAARLAFDVSEGATYRGFFSTHIVLIGLFGACFYLSRKDHRFSSNYLFIIMGSCFLTAFLSATRGWTLAFALIIFSFCVFIIKLSPKRVLSVVVIALFLGGGLLQIPIVGKQFSNATERLMTLESLADGDLSAGGTLSRIEERSPRVMNKWRESMLTGWGFSDTFFDYRDFHVGNQNILLHGGILGAFVLLGFFFVYFSRLGLLWLSLPLKHPDANALLVFPLFFMGWFLIHSTSGQHFSLYLELSAAMTQAPFFGLGAVLYRVVSNNQFHNHEEKEDSLRNLALQSGRN